MLRTPTVASVAPTAHAVPIVSLLAVAGVSAVPTLVTAARGGTNFSLALVAAAIVGGAGFAYAIDDDAAVVLAPSPTTLARRRVVRLAVALLVVAAGWELVVATAAAADAVDGTRWGDLAVEAFTAAGVAVAAATVATRRGAGEKAGTGGVAAAVLTLLTVTSMAQRYSWLPRVAEGPHHTRWLWLAAASWAVAAWASRDPAGRR